MEIENIIIIYPNSRRHVFEFFVIRAENKRDSFFEVVGINRTKSEKIIISTIVCFTKIDTTHIPK